MVVSQAFAVHQAAAVAFIVVKQYLHGFLIEELTIEKRAVKCQKISKTSADSAVSTFAVRRHRIAVFINRSEFQLFFIIDRNVCVFIHSHGIGISHSARLEDIFLQIITILHLGYFFDYVGKQLVIGIAVSHRRSRFIKQRCLIHRIQQFLIRDPVTVKVAKSVIQGIAFQSEEESRLIKIIRDSGVHVKEIIDLYSFTFRIVRKILVDRIIDIKLSFFLKLKDRYRGKNLAAGSYIINRILGFESLSVLFRCILGIEAHNIIICRNNKCTLAFLFAVDQKKIFVFFIRIGPFPLIFRKLNILKRVALFLLLHASCKGYKDREDKKQRRYSGYAF